MMEWKQFTSLDSEAAGRSTVSYRVEQELPFEHGTVEIRRYYWAQPASDLVFATEDQLALNMALTARPATTRIVRADGDDKAASHGGRLMMLLPRTRYRLTAPSGSLRSIHCAFDPAKFEQLLSENFDWADWSRLDEQHVPGAEMEGLLRRMYREVRHCQFGRQAAVEAYANALCVEIARRIREGLPARPELHRGGLAAWRMRLLLERIGADAPAPRIAELAALCALTPRQLSRAFRAETGRTIGSLVDEATVERAQNLLATTDLTIGAIAARLGFASVDTFAQSFRRMTGMAPSQLRRS